MANWYVRPNSLHATTRTGTSYAAAWGGWSEISWASLAAGDVLFVCGQHSYSSIITVGAHGGSAAASVTFDGNYAADPGSIAFVGSVFFNNNTRYTRTQNIAFTGGTATSPCVFHQSGAKNNAYVNNTFTLTGGAGISFYGDTGQHHADVLVEGNTFTGVCSMDPGVGAAVEWYGGTAGVVSSLARATIRKNTFRNLMAGRSILHFRSIAGTTCTMTDIAIDDNVFQNCQGGCMEVRHRTESYGLGSGIKIRRNTFTNCTVSPVTNTSGGCIAVDGFAHSGTFGFGPNEIRNNTGSNVVGVFGGVNAYYGSYHIQNNAFSDLSTLTIDGNGVLMDYGNKDCVITGNRFARIKGKAGVFNSGCALMLLDSTNCLFSGNVAIGCKAGILIGDQGTPSHQSGAFWNNTFLDVQDFAIYVVPNPNLASIEAKNNIFQGAGYSVYDASFLTWTGENYNIFAGFPSGLFQHVLGGFDSQSDPIPYLRADGSLAAPVASNPLATAGQWRNGVRLANGRLRPGFSPAGAYMGAFDGLSKTNSAPTLMLLSTLSVSETATVGATVATISANGSPAPSFVKIADPDGKFSIVGNALTLAATVDSQIAASHSVTILASNLAGSLAQTFVITVSAATPKLDFSLAANSQYLPLI